MFHITFKALHRLTDTDILKAVHCLFFYTLISNTLAIQNFASHIIRRLPMKSRFVIVIILSIIFSSCLVNKTKVNQYPLNYKVTKNNLKKFSCISGYNHSITKINGKKIYSDDRIYLLPGNYTIDVAYSHTSLPSGGYKKTSSASWENVKITIKPGREYNLISNRIGNKRRLILTTPGKLNIRRARKDLLE